MKKMRSPDLMLYLRAYNPTYIEWLNDQSCNVHFADHAAAQRAYDTLFKELPDPPPRKVIANKKQQQRHHKQGAAASSSSLLVPNSPLDAGSHAAAAFALVQSYYATAAAAAAANTEPSVPPMQLPPWPPLGAYGWKLGPPLTKAKNDKFGSAGLSARLLCRFATSLDVLTERPKTRPPNHTRGRGGGGGGGGGDYYGEPANKKRQKKQQRELSSVNIESRLGGMAHPTTAITAADDGTDTTAPSVPRPVLPATKPTDRRVASAAFAAAFKDPKRKLQQTAPLAPEEVNPKLRRLVMNADGSLARKPKKGAAEDSTDAVAGAAAGADEASGAVTVKVETETIKEASSTDKDNGASASQTDPAKASECHREHGN